MKTLILTFILFFCVFIVYAQCIDKEKITYGGDWSDYDYTYFCPTYNFSYDGNKSKEWNDIDDPIDINQVGKQVFPLKKHIESLIIRYAGMSFFNKLKFSSVLIVYPDSLEKFADRMPTCCMDSCRAKYFFYYLFSPIKEAKYNIGIAVSKDWKIVNKFNFPSKKDYRVVDTSITICRVVKIAETFKNKILPIDNIRLDYDSKDKKFYWIVKQEVFQSSRNPPKSSVYLRSLLVWL